MSNLIKWFIDDIKEWWNGDDKWTIAHEFHTHARWLDNDGNVKERFKVYLTFLESKNGRRDYYLIPNDGIYRYHPIFKQLNNCGKIWVKTGEISGTLECIRL